MPSHEAPSVELGSAPNTGSVGPSPSPSEISSTSSSEPVNVRAPPLFRVLAMTPPEPAQPPGQDELERRLPGYRRIVIPRELTLIELLKQCSGAINDDDVLRIREAKLRVVAERVGLRRIHVLVPRLRSLTLDGSAISSLRDLGIGLIRLKFLSVNRCGLTSLDGVWGLGALRELYATGNKIQDLQPLAALQKLHTVDLSDNPISESSRLWTLGVCSSLRHLTLRGTPASEDSSYRSRVASALPMLMYLDERPLHNDIEYDSDNVFGAMSSSSDSEPEEEKLSLDPTAEPTTSLEIPEQQPGPSTSKDMLQTVPEHSIPSTGGDDAETSQNPNKSQLRRRPATTEGIGSRPEKPVLPRRPHTAQAKGEKGPRIELSKLQMMSTLLDDEWGGSGSSLTSRGAVCGNLARALRRPSISQQRKAMNIKEIEMELAAQTINDAARALAAEIPRAPCLEDWNKFRQETGIEIEIDFTERPKGIDPTTAIERLEQIEKETVERLNREKHEKKLDETRSSTSTAIDRLASNMSVMEDALGYDCDIWTAIEELAPVGDPVGEVDDVFSDVTPVQRNLDSRNRRRRLS